LTTFVSSIKDVGFLLGVLLYRFNSAKEGMIYTGSIYILGEGNE
jgi:hypothetical protein